MTPTNWLIRQARRVSVSRRLAWTFALVTVLPLFVTTGILATISTNSTRATLQAQAEGSIGQVADSVSAQLDALQRSAVKLSYRDALQWLLTAPSGQDHAGALARANGYARDEFELTDYVVAVQVSPDAARWYQVLGDDPAIVSRAASAGPAAMREIDRQGGRSVYQSFRARTGGTPGNRGRESGFIQQWRPVYDAVTRQRIGVMVITVQEGYLSSIVTRVSEIQGSRAVIVAHHSNQVISNVGPGLMRTGDTPTSSVALGNLTAEDDEVQLEGKNYSAVTASVANTDLIAALLIPTDHQFTAQQAVLQAFFAIAAIAAIVAILVSAVMARSVSQPISRLMRKISVLEQVPDAHLSEDDGSDELAALDARFNQLVVQNLEHAKARELDTLERHKMELRVVQAQVNPHFLANALGSMRELASIGNSGAVAQLSDALARMINRTFRRRDDWTTLSDEFQSVADFAVIASFRHAGNITVDTDLPVALADCAIPQFILQPLVENAYIHGFGRGAGGGRIQITASLSDGETVLIEVRDNGAGIGPSEGTDSAGDSRSSALGMTRFGLRSVRDRLRLMYDDQAGMTIQSEPWIFTVVRVTVPWKVATK